MTTGWVKRLKSSFGSKYTT